MYLRRILGADVEAYVDQDDAMSVVNDCVGSFLCHLIHLSICRLFCYKHKMLHTDDKECCYQRDSQCISYRWSIIMMYMMCVGVSHCVSLIGVSYISI